MWFLRLEPQSYSTFFFTFRSTCSGVSPLASAARDLCSPVTAQQFLWENIFRFSLCYYGKYPGSVMKFKKCFYFQINPGESLVSEEQITINHPEFFSASRIWSPKSEQDDSSPSSIKTRLIFFILFLRIHGM